MANPVLNPSPKDRFQSSADNVSKHRNLVDLGEFQRAADFALLEYVGRQMMEMNPQTPGATAFKIQGAQEFLHEFRLLSEAAPKLARPMVIQNLDHSQK